MYETCSECSGRGVYLCPICEGDGSTIEYGEPVECAHCEGHGRVACDECDRRGYHEHGGYFDDEDESSYDPSY